MFLFRGHCLLILIETHIIKCIDACLIQLDDFCYLMCECECECVCVVYKCRCLGIEAYWLKFLHFVCYKTTYTGATKMSIWHMPTGTMSMTTTTTTGSGWSGTSFLANHAHRWILNAVCQTTDALISIPSNEWHKTDSLHRHHAYGHRILYCI